VILALSDGDDTSVGAAEVVMRDLKADWRKWTAIERVAAALVAFVMSSAVPVLLLLGRG
jgi:hypothetical protein